MLDGLRDDVRDGWRSLRRRHGFAGAAIAMLAVGLGVNVAGVAILYGVLYRTLPFPDADRLVVAYETGATPFSPATFLDVRASTTHVFTALAATMAPGDVTLTGGDWTAAVPAVSTTPELFQVMGVPPLLGRTLTADDAAAGDVVISARLWRTRLGGDAAILGRSIVLDGTPWTVVGVMPEGVALPAVDIWRPLALTPAQWASRNSFMFTSLGRLGPGVDLATARNALVDAVNAATLPSRRKGAEPPTIQTFQQESTAFVRDRIWFAQATLLALLLIVCINLSGVLLAHGRLRDQELAVRAALGAGRLRLLRQLAVEYLLLGTAGGALAVVVGAWVVRLLLANYPGGLPASGTIGIHPAEVAAAVGLSVLATLLFGLVPAIAGSKPRAIHALIQSQTTEPRRAKLFRAGLVTAETALSLSMAAGATLLATSYGHLVGQPIGFDPAGLQVASVSAPSAECPKPDACGQTLEAVVDRIALEPGFARVAGALPMPFDRTSIAERFTADAVHGETPQFIVATAAVSSDFFSILRIPIVAGRTFRRDEEVSGGVAIVSREFSRRYGPNGNALGMRLHSPTMTVVGVVGDVRANYFQTPRAFVYLPLGQSSQSSMNLIVQPRDSAGATAAALPELVHMVAPKAPIRGVRSMTALMGESVATNRFNTALLAIVAGLSVGLVAIGVYGMAALVVGQRRREMGIRLALGARPSQAVRLVVLQGLRPIAFGLAGGLAGGWWLTSLLRSQLFQIAPHDPRVLLAATAIVFAVGILANWIPARHCRWIDPIQTLRTE